MKRPLIIVGGLERSGASLVCQMFAAGGLEVAGEAPDYQPAFMWSGAPASRRDEAVAEGDFDVLRWCDPHKEPLRLARPAFGLWVRRDFEEQARSQAKVLGEELLRPERLARAAELRAEAAEGRRALQDVCGARPSKPAAEGAPGALAKSIAFEHLVEDPHSAAAWLYWFARRIGKPFGQKAAAGAVIRRPGACRPDLSIEAGLLAGATP